MQRYILTLAAYRYMQKDQKGKKCLSYMPALCLHFYCKSESSFQQQIVDAGIDILAYLQQGVVNKLYECDEKYITAVTKKLKMFYKLLADKYGNDAMQQWLERKFAEGRQKYGLWNYNILIDGEDVLTDVERLLDGFCRHLIAWSKLDENNITDELADHTAGLITNVVMAINRMMLYKNLQNKSI